MLQIQNISKSYRTGELVQKALDGVSLTLRDCEFVSILGPSGSGKTTLLNIIGGLDHYDSGDLLIGGTSTKRYTHRDWDAYRNHTIGFVFQNYNLIPHQSILSNVELALTISGISRAQRRRRAQKALEDVGLGDQLYKRPNQLSGGQMQRVAIARALVNNPDILLADEPTGALDTQTSIQVLDLLKEVARDRLVVMVTHNPELAQTYSTRIIQLRDGRIVSDTNPFEPEVQVKEKKSTGKAKMSFLTALSLSFNNLRTKKGRTFLTALAGSIGIIGIALILAISAGVDNYITDIQRDTMSSYPITIQAKTMDLSGMIGLRDSMMTHLMELDSQDKDRVYASTWLLETQEAVKSNVTENDLTAFKRYLDNPDSPIHAYLGENGVVYSYDVNFNVYSYDKDGVLVSTDADPEEAAGKVKQQDFQTMMMENMQAAILSARSGAQNFCQIMPGVNGEPVSQVVTDNYELLVGAWPENHNEVVLVLGSDNSLDLSVLYQLGFVTREEYASMAKDIEKGGTPETLSWSYESLMEHTFYMVPACDHYTKNEDGTFRLLTDTEQDRELLLEESLPLTISGIIRPVSGSSNLTLTAAVAYTSAMTDYLIDHTAGSPVVLAQEKTPETNVLTGMVFDAPTDEEKMEDAKTYIRSMGVSDKASLYGLILYYGQQEGTQPGSDDGMQPTESTEPGTEIPDAGTNTQGPGEIQLPTDPAPAPSDPEQGWGEMPSDGGGFGGMMAMDESTMAAALELWLEQDPDPAILLSIYDQYIAGATYEDNMMSFGKVSYDAPSAISLYTDSFDAKDAIFQCIADYNEQAPEEEYIAYTDYVALLTSSITSIVDVISYVLIAFVAVSLVVSSIMIGIITHISVMERTREIGILRAMGASKANISHVFNAETMIIGLFSGLLGVGVSALLTIPANAVLRNLVSGLAPQAHLPLGAAAILVVLSVGITLLGGLIPAQKAANKDPVVALRTE